MTPTPAIASFRESEKTVKTMEQDDECRRLRTMMVMMRSNREVLEGVRRAMLDLRQWRDSQSGHTLSDTITGSFDDPYTLLIVYLIFNIIMWCIAVFTFATFSDQVRRMRFEWNARAAILSEIANRVNEITNAIRPESGPVISQRIDRLIDANQHDLGYYRGFTSVGYPWHRAAPGPSTSLLTPPTESDDSNSRLLSPRRVKGRAPASEAGEHGSALTIAVVNADNGVADGAHSEDRRDSMCSIH